MKPDASIARRRTAIYWMVGLGLLIIPGALHGNGWRGSAHLHTVMEALATQLSMGVGILALVRYYSRKDNTFLLIGVAFLGTAFLDGYHAIVTSEMFKPLMPSDLPALIPWSWVASRLFLSVMMFLSWAAWSRERKRGTGGRVNERAVYWLVALFTLTSFGFFAFFPLPVAYYPEIFFHRPEEFVPALFFLIALVGYLRKGKWREDPFEHWVVLSLIVGFVGQSVFMSHSGVLFDYEFDLAHLLKKVGYLCVLAGLLISVYATFRRSIEQGQRLGAFVDNTVDGIFTVDLRGTIESVNPAMQNIFGYKADELVGQGVALIVPDGQGQGDRKHPGGSGPHALQVTGRSRELSGRRKDGSEFPVELTVSRMDYGGKTRFAGIVRNISDRRESKQRLAAIIDNTIDGIITIDSKGIIETVNPAVQSIFGYRPDELLGQNVAVLLPVDERPQHQGYLDNSDLHAPRIINQSRDLEGRRKDGSTFPIELTVTRMDYDGKTMFAGIVRDITERKKTERMKNEFVSTVSHELRTPLTSIKGSLGLIRAGAVGDLPEQVGTMVEIAYSNSERLVRLINDILDIEKIEAGKVEFRMEVQNLSALVSGAIEANAAYAAQFGVSLELTGTVPGDRIFGDAGRLQQVFTNLISNAAKFSPEGGEVRISVTRVGANIRVAVHDDGPGIPREHRDDIFGKFFQADASDSRQKGGTGLGLNIAKTIIDMHRGEIFFECEPDAGTTFYVDLPAWHDKRLGGRAVPRKATGPKILVCEDEPDIAALLSFILRRGGYQPTVVHSAAEAKERLASDQFRAMTLDIKLPDQDGFSLLREIRARPETRDLPIIVVSALPSEDADKLNGDAFGLVDWLEKPIDKQRLADALDAATRFAGRHPRILHVEDDPDIREIVSMLLKGVADVIPAGSFSDAETALKRDEFDLVILDLGLPDRPGEDLLPLLKRRDRTVIPTVIFSVDEVSGALAERVWASLVKSRTTNEVLLQTIGSAIESASHRGEVEEVPA
jgi:PAS domain S-box-containing protein